MNNPVDLDKDVWGLVLQHFDPVDVAKARLCCRLWHVSTSSAVSKLDFRHKKKMYTTKFISSFPNLRVVKVAGVAGEDFLTQLQFASIQKLVLERAELSGQVVGALRRLPALTQLALRGCAVPGDAPLQDLALLTRLQLKHCDIKSPSSLLQQLTSPLRIRHLTLEHTVTPQQEQELLTHLPLLPSLTSINIALHCAPSQRSQDSLCLLPHLESVSLVVGRGPWPPEVMPQIAAHLARLPSLKHLHLRAQCTMSVSDQDLITVATAAPQLQALSLDAVVARSPSLLEAPQSPPWTVTPLGIKSLSQLPALSHLSLAGCCITKEGLAEVATLRHVTSLDLSGCALVDDSFLFKVAEMTQLQHLVLIGCSMISDIGVAALTKALQGLTHVDLSGCDRFLSDHGVGHLASLPRLQSLSLSCCPHLSDASVQVLASLRPPLRSLLMRGCGLTNSAAESIAFGLPSLKTLDLGWCFEINVRGAQQLSRLQGLKTLSLLETQVSPQEAAQLLPHVRNLKASCSNSWWLRRRAPRNQGL